VTLDRQIRGWGDAFRMTNQRVVFHQVDAEIDKTLRDYRLWFNRLSSGLPNPAQRQLLGVALLADTLRDAGHEDAGAAALPVSDELLRTRLGKKGQPRWPGHVPSSRRAAIRDDPRACPER
jgi:hypothetical protein